MGQYTNIAAYRFARLTHLKELRARLLGLCTGWKLKGTILLSTEGINLFIAGSRENVDLLLAELRSQPGLESLQPKLSESDHLPFTRMLVRIKKEIIAFGVEGIDPASRPSPKVSAATLKAWLDEGRDITLLDTRNDYEVKLGTFRNALPVDIQHFRDFPEAVRKLPDSLKEKPIVMFCTGGIRCEKAGPFMEREGFRNIFQLDGGILKYFEECGGDHYEGECFVFDQRVGVDPTLQETASAQCFQCLSPLTPMEQRDPRFVAGQSCPHCYRSEEQQAAVALERHRSKLNAIRSPLPGSVPYDNYRPISVPRTCEGFTAREFLRNVLPHISESEWSQLAEQGLFYGPEKQPTSLDRRVKAGERYYRKLPALVEPDVDARITVLHEDVALIVVSKPAPLPMHPGGRFNRNTLEYFLHEAYRPEKPRPAHRLDANTTGVVVLTRSRHFASRLQPQFAEGTVEKRYLARVVGAPPSDRFVCDAPITSGPSDLGARTTTDPTEGLASLTEFRVLLRADDGTSIVEARPKTGRTNQIRIHLQHLGWPICGDPTYLSRGERGDQQTLNVSDTPMCLHAWQVTLSHPITARRETYQSPPPDWVPVGLIN